LGAIARGLMPDLRKRTTTARTPPSIVTGPLCFDVGKLNTKRAAQAPHPMAELATYVEVEKVAQCQMVAHGGAVG
jgi:hypothetical protein